ncbi:type I-E CRISPR-associated protein Cas6/Cse3/CasE [Streptomyces sp. NPDC085529]|uniref:type I-E CRISPR-associated protein Cas6/Cse3/CasE n=1 Tax=Streptomyces sp. NPDC085529 TaxID=3365729 RepID=UPI0037D51B23
MTTNIGTGTGQLSIAQIQLNPASRVVHRDLADPGNMHRTVMNLIDRDRDNPTARRDANLLYRTERNPAGAALLVQATVPLHPDRLPDDYALTRAQRDATPILHWITAGRTVRYRIHGNPDTCVRDPKALQDEADRRAESAVKAGKSYAEATKVRDEFLERVARNAAKRRGITLPATSDNINAWWTRTAEANGLRLELVIDSPLPRINATRSSGRAVTLGATAFDGIATITDPDAVRAAVTNGIGKGQAYGLGLLSLAPHTG